MIGTELQDPLQVLGRRSGGRKPIGWSPIDLSKYESDIREKLRYSGPMPVSDITRVIRDAAARQPSAAHSGRRTPRPTSAKENHIMMQTSEGAERDRELWQHRAVIQSRKSTAAHITSSRTCETGVGELHM